MILRNDLVSNLSDNFTNFAILLLNKTASSSINFSCSSFKNTFCSSPCSFEGSSNSSNLTHAFSGLWWCSNFNDSCSAVKITFFQTEIDSSLHKLIDGFFLIQIPVGITYIYIYKLNTHIYKYIPYI